MTKRREGGRRLILLEFILSPFVLLYEPRKFCLRLADSNLSNALPAMSGALAVNSALRASQPALRGASQPAPPAWQPKVAIRVDPRSYQNRPG
jgi:hypothetical protein